MIATDTRTWSGTDCTTCSSSDSQYVRIPIHPIIYTGDPDSTVTPNDIHIGTNRRQETEEERKKYWKRLYLKWKAQWILRQGPFIRYDPPQLMPIQRAVMYRKILRCNRRGIGLRIKKSK